MPAWLHKDSEEVKALETVNNTPEEHKAHLSHEVLAGAATAYVSFTSCVFLIMNLTSMSSRLPTPGRSTRRRKARKLSTRNLRSSRKLTVLFRIADPVTDWYRST